MAANTVLSSASKMCFQFNKYRSLLKALCLLIFLVVCLLLRYYMSVVPGTAKFDLSKVVKVSEIDSVCSNMRRLCQGTARQQTQVTLNQATKTAKSSHLIAQRIVHLDLKGAPPKISYYRELFKFLSHHNATGVLIEYEDMFPYWGPLLSHVPALNAYTKKDIQSIVKEAKKNKLEIIPLIQSFGHFEFLLKHKNYRELREVPSYPNVICPLHNSSMLIIQTMIDQIIQLHPGIGYLHIGCDEVYELGKCNRCQSFLYETNWVPSQLFLYHVSKVAKYVRTVYPAITPLIWEDHLRTLTVEQIRESKIAEIVEPVVWNYHPNVAEYITHETWNVYCQVFQNMWIASAFKGATSPDSILPHIQNHLENHVAWAKIVDNYSHLINFRGIMITGWQRYDHFAILCELFPSGVPSLIVALQYMQTYQTRQTQNIGALLEPLECGGAYPVNVHDIPFDGIECEFPGSGVLKAVSQLSAITEQANSYKTPTTRGWLSPLNIKYNASNPYLVLSSTMGLTRIRRDVEVMEREFRTAASLLYDGYTIDEWLATNTRPLVKWIDNLLEARERLLAQNDWPRRPFNLRAADET